MFDQLYYSVMKNELGYNPSDQGSETYNGIWRSAWPGWEGWKIIDTIPNKKRGQTFYNHYPQLEVMAKDFYRIYWKPLQVEKLNNLKVAEMLADISTQHGGWKKIIYGALNKLNPLAKTTPAVYTEKEIQIINSDPAKYYKLIADARLYYSTNVYLKNEADRKGIINRAKKYVSLAMNWAKNNPAAVAGGSFFFYSSL